MRVVFVQTGDFRAARQRISNGLGETFHAQEYSMEVVEHLVGYCGSVTVVCVASEHPHDETAKNGIRSIGINNIWKSKHPFRHVIKILDDLHPTHLILRLPSIQLLRWADRKDVPVLVTLADSFTPRRGIRGFIDRWKAAILAKQLNHDGVHFVGNHNIAASEALAAIGVYPEKIIPWDWPRSPTPSEFPVKTLSPASRKHLIYVGSVSEGKGVGDLLRALAAYSIVGGDVTLEICGSGQIADMRQLADELNIIDRVKFKGQVPHRDVALLMHEADAVIVYSRHEYGEGLPGTIYLGLASRTPVILSDHPMFLAYFKNCYDALIVPEKDPVALATRLRELFEDPDLYYTLSENSAAAFSRIEHPVLWGDLVERWVRGADFDIRWLNNQVLNHWR